MGHNQKVFEKPLRLHVGVMEAAFHCVILHTGVQKQNKTKHEQFVWLYIPPRWKRQCKVKFLGGSRCTLASKAVEQAWKDWLALRNESAPPTCRPYSSLSVSSFLSRSFSCLEFFQQVVTLEQLSDFDVKTSYLMRCALEDQKHQKYLSKWQLKHVCTLAVCDNVLRLTVCGSTHSHPTFLCWKAPFKGLCQGKCKQHKQGLEISKCKSSGSIAYTSCCCDEKQWNSYQRFHKWFNNIWRECGVFY